MIYEKHEIIVTNIVKIDPKKKINRDEPGREDGWVRKTSKSRMKEAGNGRGTRARVRLCDVAPRLESGVSVGDNTLNDCLINLSPLQHNKKRNGIITHSKILLTVFTNHNPKLLTQNGSLNHRRTKRKLVISITITRQLNLKPINHTFTTLRVPFNSTRAHIPHPRTFLHKFPHRRPAAHVRLLAANFMFWSLDVWISSLESAGEKLTGCPGRNSKGSCTTKSGQVVSFFLAKVRPPPRPRITGRMWYWWPGLTMLPSMSRTGSGWADPRRGDVMKVKRRKRSSAILVITMGFFVIIFCWTNNATPKWKASIPMKGGSSSMLMADSSSCGGIARDNNASWILGFAHRIGRSNSFQAEAWAVWSALRIAKDRNWPKVIIETDSFVSNGLFDFDHEAAARGSRGILGASGGHIRQEAPSRRELLCGSISSSAIRRGGGLFRHSIVVEAY
ncbi:ribonuclease H [Senna tora]|uniref:Ribonuclease H n=1 Tax=Senna tora TaxID=362788 RepID=A0A834TEJ3_9FABA|nr:ribonuclease H [Senna tora]